MTFSNITFAPLNTPLRRRLQTVAVVAWFSTQVVCPFILWVLCLYLILYTKLWWISLMYVLWFLFIDTVIAERGDRRSKWVRNWAWWRYLRDYFPVKMVKTTGVELDPAKNYLFCFFPHGMLSTGAFLAAATDVIGFPEEFPDHKPYIHTLAFFFNVPLLRELGLWLGGLTASANAMNYVLGKPEGGNVAALVVGGAAEGYYCKPGWNKIFYKKRKGFIKIALRNGSPLVPVYCFGETDLYDQFDLGRIGILRVIRDFVRRTMGFALILPLGRGIFQYSYGILPHRRPVTVVVGEPLNITKIEEPTQEDIDNVHKMFENRLVELFEKEKKNYIKDYKNAQLEIL